MSHAFGSHHLRRLFLVLVFSCLASIGIATGSVLTSGSNNQIRFAAMQMDVKVDGEFRNFTADIAFDPARPESGQANLDIDLASVSTGSAEADTVLKGRDFFDAAHFPRASFLSTRIITDGQGHYQAIGRFTLKGHSADLTGPFTARSGPDGLLLEGSMAISRLAYKVGEGEWSDTGTLADQVQIRFKLHLPR